MKKYNFLAVFLLSMALIGCSNNDGINVQDELRTQSNEASMEEHHTTMQKQIDELTGEITQLKKQNELLPTFSKLAFEFVEAIDEQDQRLLKTVVSSDFVIEMTNQKWYYHAKEEVDGSNKVLLSDDNNDIEGWYIDYYGVVPNSNQYGMTLRLLTEQGISHAVPEVLNIQFAEQDGVWKVVSVDRFI